MSEPVEPLVLGLEMAQALAAEERHRAGGVAPSPLAGVAYPADAAALWRWIPAAEDATISGYLDGYARLDRGQAAAARAALTIDDFYQLLTFARRAILAAVRTGEERQVRGAMDALSAIDLERVDWRDVHVAAALVSYGAERLDLDAGELAERAGRRADPMVAGLLGQAAATTVQGARAAGYREVERPDGRVFVDDGGRWFRPAGDLVGVAFALADALERDAYQVSGITTGSDLPAVWLGQDTDALAARSRLSGCVSVDAVPRADPGDRFLLVFLAEAAGPAEATAIATAADAYALPDSAQFGAADGRCCAVVISRSGQYGEESPETAGSLERFRPTVASLLRT